MRYTICTLVLIPSFVALAPAAGSGRASAQTAFSVSAQIGDFHVAVANYYHVPEREVVVIRERRIPDDEIPVALFIARHAGVPWARVVDMRLRGDSWWDISVRFGLSPEVYYVPVTVVSPGPPYGRALGHYKKKNRKEWKTIVLSDADVVNMVQLRFISEHYRVAPERVIEMRGSKQDFVAIHSEVRGGGKGKADNQRMVSTSREQAPAAREQSSAREQGSSAKSGGKGRGGKKKD